MACRLPRPSNRLKELAIAALFALVANPATATDVVLVSETSGKLLFVDTASPNPLDSVIAAVPLTKVAAQRVAVSVSQGLAFIAHNRQGAPAHGFLSVVDIANVLSDTNPANDLVATWTVPATPSGGGQNVGDVTGLSVSADGTRLLVITAALVASGGSPGNEGTAYLFDTDRSSGGFGTITASTRLLGNVLNGALRPGASNEAWTPNGLGVTTANAEPGIHVRNATTLAAFVPSRNMANFGPLEAFSGPVMLRFDATGSVALVPMSTNGTVAAINATTRTVLASRMQFGVAGGGACAAVGTSWPQTAAFSPLGNRALATLLGGRPFSFGCGGLTSAIHGIGFGDFNGTAFSNVGTLAVNTSIDGSLRGAEVFFGVDPDDAFFLTTRGVLIIDAAARTRTSLLRLGFCTGEGTSNQAGVDATIGAPRRIADYRDLDADGLSDARCDPSADTTPPAVAVVSPNGGETLTNGVATTITWTASDAGGLGGFDVAFSTNGGGSFSPIAECQSLPGSATSCTWLSPTPDTTQALVRVTARDVSLNEAADASDAVFTIETPACPAITVAPPPHALVGANYSTTLVATGSSNAPYTYSVVGTLPSGLTLAGDTLSGTPTETGTFKIRATDTASCEGTSDTVVIGSVVAPGDVVISEFRTRGPLGDLDEYVEVANRTNAPIVVLGPDGTGGWSIATTASVLATIPDGTIIPRGGHWLLAGARLGLAANADASLSSEDIPDGAGLALFRTADDGAFSTATRLDAVGSVIESDPLFYEGTRLPDVVQLSGGFPTSPTYEVAWVRRTTQLAILSDVGDNARDFVFIATDGSTGYGPGADVAAVLGGPNPEGTASLVDVLNPSFPVALADPARSESASPNRVVVPMNRIDFRRGFTNNTGQPVTALAFKVIALSTLNERRRLTVRADLRVASAPIATFGSGIGSVDPTTLEHSSRYPLIHTATSSPVGGLNSRLLFPSVSPASPLPQGGTIGVNFRATIWTSGYYIFIVLPQVEFGG